MKRKQIKLPESIYQRLKALAKQNKRTMVSEIDRLVEEKEKTLSWEKSFGENTIKALNL